MAVPEEMNNGEILKEAIENLKKVQVHMLPAREENAAKTYAGLKDDYLSLKVLLKCKAYWQFNRLYTFS